MDNKETILDELTCFQKKKTKEISPLLEEYLLKVARTGDTIFPWSKLKPLIMHKMEEVITDFHRDYPTENIPQCPNVEKFAFDMMREKLLETVNTFTSAPFTIQRLCELVTTPRLHYRRTDKFMRGLEKNVLVVSTVEPRGVNGNRSQSGSESPVMVNGILDMHNNYHGPGEIDSFSTAFPGRVADSVASPSSPTAVDSSSDKAEPTSPVDVEGCSSSEGTSEEVEGASKELVETPVESEDSSRVSAQPPHNVRSPTDSLAAGDSATGEEKVERDELLDPQPTVAPPLDPCGDTTVEERGGAVGDVHMDRAEGSPGQADREVPMDRSDGEVPIDRSDCEVPMKQTDDEVPIDRTDREVPMDRSDCEVPIDQPDGEVPNDRSDCEVPRCDGEVPVDRSDREVPTNKPDRCKVDTEASGDHKHAVDSTDDTELQPAKKLRLDSEVTEAKQEETEKECEASVSSESAAVVPSPEPPVVESSSDRVEPEHQAHSPQPEQPQCTVSKSSPESSTQEQCKEIAPSNQEQCKEIGPSNQEQCKEIAPSHEEQCKEIAPSNQEDKESSGSPVEHHVSSSGSEPPEPMEQEESPQSV